MSLLPPGRFLMPGDLAGSPALTFAPLELPARRAAAGFAAGDDGAALRGLQRRGGAAVLPRAFRAARPPDRAGRRARGVQCRAGRACAISKVRSPRSSTVSASGGARLLSALFGPRIDRILFAATKADHLHHVNHDRLEAILARMVERAASAPGSPARDVDVVALAAVRATREARVRAAATNCPSIIGMPAAGESRRRRDLRRRDRSGDVSGRSAGRSGRAVRADALAFAASPRSPKTPIFASCASGRRAGGQRCGVAGSAPHSPRPRAAIPDRRSARMSERPRKPAAFRLDDPHVVVTAR